jgi:Tol biopolymer transport system component
MSAPSQSAFQPSDGDRLDSWKQIARYLNRTVRTVQRWEIEEGLPVHRRGQCAANRSPVHAYRSELDQWLKRDSAVDSRVVESTIADWAVRDVGPAEVRTRPHAVLATGWRTRSNTLTITVAAILFVCVCGIAAWKFSTGARASTSLRMVKLTDYPGRMRNPSLSPDGKRFAFSWNGKNQDNFDIYVRSIDSGVPVRLTSNPASDKTPAWSPDGRYIAFVRKLYGESQVAAVVVPANGGEEHTVGKCFPVGPDGDAMNLAWTADGRWLVLPSRLSGSSNSLVLVSPTRGESETLTHSTGDLVSDCCPAVSPDGRTLAFLRSVKGLPRQIYLLPLDRQDKPEGEPKQLTNAVSGVLHPRWIDGGRSLLYMAPSDGALTLWRTSPGDRNQPARVALLPPEVGADWDVSRQGNMAVFSESISMMEVWRMDLRDGGNLTRVISSPRSDSLDAQYSPDGNKISFVSSRPGESEVWVSDSDGNQRIKVAATPVGRVDPPRWSPDGKQLVFECLENGNHDICAVPASGGQIRRLTRNPAMDSLPEWSQDGTSIYFTSDRSGSSQIWKIPAAGDDSGAIQLTRNGGTGAVDSADGRNIYYLNQTPGVLSQVSASGGAESPVPSTEPMSLFPGLAATSRGLYFLYFSDPQKPVGVWLYPFGNHKPERIGSVVKKNLWNGISVSPDNRYLLFAAFDGSSGDLYLAYNGM